jgi:hypothetical protein
VSVEQSKRERYVLFGVVPVVAAVLGSVTTVAVQRLTGGTEVSDAVLAIIQDHTLSATDKAKLIQLANNSTDRFYAFLGSTLTAVTVLIGFSGPTIAQAIADRIRHR